jgi:hypothetical protein
MGIKAEAGIKDREAEPACVGERGVRQKIHIELSRFFHL